MNIKIKACRKISAASTPSYYYYALNSRGDVIGLYNSSGALIANYKYDAYGKLLGITNSSGSAITAKYSYGVLNPLRYRGYVYDTETGLYYLQSRYYDPTTCRFINADGLVATGQGITGNNMFSYCGNNSISFVDVRGYRYCSAANPDEETSLEREQACIWQNWVTRSKYNPEPDYAYSGGNIYIVGNFDQVATISAAFPGDIIVVDELSIDGNLYIYGKRRTDVRRIYRDELMDILNSYAHEQGAQTYKIAWERETSWKEYVDVGVIIIGIASALYASDIKSVVFGLALSSWDIYRKCD